MSFMPYFLVIKDQVEMHPNFLQFKANTLSSYLREKQLPTREPP